MNKHYITFKRLYDSSCIVITDNYKSTHLDLTEENLNYYFEVMTGELTLPFFKSLNFKYCYVYFFTQNLENFFNIFYEFPYLNFEIVNVLYVKTKEELFKEHLKFYKDDILAKKSYDLSYVPDMKSSIETSLRYLDEYYSMHDQNTIRTQLIISILSDGPKTYKEMIKKINFNEVDFKKILSSLIFFKVIGKINEKYKLLFRLHG